MRTRRRDSGGQGLVEFALVFPVFILLVLGLFDVGRAVLAYNTLTNAAREAARLGIVNQDEASIADRAQAIAVGIGIDTTDPDLVAFYKKGPNTDVEANDECDGSTEERELSVACVVVVKPSTTWQAITPVIGTLIGPITMQARSELPIEFVCPTGDIPEFSSAGSCPKQP
jgi:Flp pilus assembly protein TadG